MTSTRLLGEGQGLRGRGWGCAQIYAVLEAEAGKVVGVAVEGLAVEYLVAGCGQRGQRRGDGRYPMMSAAAVRMVAGVW